MTYYNVAISDGGGPFLNVVVDRERLPAVFDHGARKGDAGITYLVEPTVEAPTEEELSSLQDYLDTNW